MFISGCSHIAVASQSQSQLWTRINTMLHGVAWLSHSQSHHSHTCEECLRCSPFLHTYDGLSVDRYVCPAKMFLCYQATKLVAVLLRVARVTAGLAESNGSLLLGLWLTSPAGWLSSTGISSGTLHSVIVYGLPLPLLFVLCALLCSCSNATCINKM